MTLLIDPPNASGHGRLWSHLASDTSYEELHHFALGMGVPVRGFDGDHYDIPAEWYDRFVAAGAVPVSSRELIERLTRAGLRVRKSERMRPRRPGRPLVLPPRLHVGDQVAVVLPAGPVWPETLAEGVAVLQAWGLRVRPPAPAHESGQPWLAGADAERAAALTSAWLDPEVAAVWCARGGFGSQRVLDLLDWRTLGTVPPRLLVGSSDVTALLQGFAARLGVVTVHGPGVAVLAALDDGARQAVRELVLDARAPALRGSPGAPGRAAGVLVGGNLAVLASGGGTQPVQPALGSIALLEDVREAPYRLDRFLTQLLRSGWFEGVRGVACGRFTDCGDPDVVRALLAARLGPLGVPVVHDLPIGHDAGTVAVPLGVTARIDGDAGVLGFEGPVLR